MKILFVRYLAFLLLTLSLLAPNEILAQPTDLQDLPEYTGDLSTFDPEAFQRENFDIPLDETATTYRLQEALLQTLGPGFNIIQLYAMMRAYQHRNFPTQLRDMSPEVFDELTAQVETFRILWEAEEKLRSENLAKGLLESDDPKDPNFRIFKRIREQDPKVFLDTLNAELSRSGRSALTDEEGRDIARLTNEVLNLAQRLIQNPPEDLVKYTADRNATDRLRLLADRNRLQLPLQANGKPFESKEDLKGKNRVEITWAGAAPVIRIILANRPERIILRDDLFTSRLDPYYLLFIARQLVRSGDGSGCDIISFALGPKIAISEFTARPPVLSMERLRTFKVAAFPPITSDSVTFAVFYVFSMTGLGFFNEYLAHYGFPKIDSTLFTEGLFSLFDPSIAGQVWTDLGHFYLDHVKPLQSHIFLSTLIGLFHPTYRFVIYHGKPAWQSIKHFGFVSYWGGFWTEAVTNGVTTQGAIKVAENSLFTNAVRPPLYSAPTERSNFRMNTYRIPFWPRWKMQQLETEVIGFLPLFAAKYAALREIMLGEVNVGRYAFGLLLPLAYIATYGYFTYSKDAKERDFRDARRKLMEGLWSPFSISIMLFYYWRMFELNHLHVPEWGPLGNHMGNWMNYALPVAAGVLRWGAAYSKQLAEGKIRKPSPTLRLLALPGKVVGGICRGAVKAVKNLGSRPTRPRAPLNDSQIYRSPW